MDSVTVVTCYYKIPSKHSHESYNIWINNFLENVGCNLVVFTSADLQQYILNKRAKFQNKTKIIVENLDDNEIYLKYKNEWDYQYSIDKQQKTGRTKYCYVIWNSKLNYLRQTIRTNPFNSDKFVWTDIGCLRDHSAIEKVTKYPLHENISCGKLDIVLLKPFSNQQQEYFQDEIHFAGALFGSDADTILKVNEIFYAKFDKFIRAKKFIGCDQQIFSSIYLTHKELFNPIVPKNNFIDVWFFLWQYYGSQSKSK